MEKLERKSSLNTFLIVDVPTNRHCDLLEFLECIKNNVHDIISEEVGVRGALKILFDCTSTTFTD